jgi:hypothetical protein
MWGPFILDCLQVLSSKLFNRTEVRAALDVGTEPNHKRHQQRAPFFRFNLFSGELLLGQ